MLCKEESLNILRYTTRMRRRRDQEKGKKVDLHTNGSPATSYTSPSHYLMIIHNIMHLALASDEPHVQPVCIQTSFVEPQTAHIRYEDSPERHRTEFGDIQARSSNHWLQGLTK